MELTVAEQFVILVINPEKGRVSINNLYFRYSLTGALLMDSLDKGEISTENKRLIPSFRKNGEPVHDMIAGIIMKSTKNRRISFWVKRLTRKSSFIFREIVTSLEKKHILRRELRKFLIIIPYYRFWFTDKSVRINLIEELRGVLFYNKQPTNKQGMLIGLVKASKAYSSLTREKSERILLRKKAKEFLKSDVMNTELNQAIKEVLDAIIASATAAALARGAH